MKKMITLAALLQLSTASASVVAILDTGTDVSHKDLAPKTWVNAKEKVGSKIDLDGSGLPGDVNGWDFTENSAKVFNNKYDNLITDEVKKFYQLYAKYETKSISKEEIDWLQVAIKNSPFMNKVNFVGSYSHGTHVGGIAVAKNKDAKILSMKILPTVYKELVEVSKDAQGKLSLEATASKEETKAETKEVEEKYATIEEFNQAIVNSAISQIKEMYTLHQYLNFHKVDVANESFGIGFMQAAEFLASGFVEAVGRVPTQEELISSIVLYFQVMRQVGPQMFEVAPNTLFVIAAGNDSSDNDLYPDYPADIQAANKIVVAATLGRTEIAEFSNFGKTKVDVAAPGVAISATAPNQNYLSLSGTSQAAPYVSNVIAKIKDINPALKAEEIKAIVLETVDVKSWLKEKVKTSGIVNSNRAFRAAQLTKEVSLGNAIAAAKAEVRDIASPKSFMPLKRDVVLDFIPLRPSLIIKATEI